jgi:hypothetical protein
VARRGNLKKPKWKAEAKKMIDEQKAALKRKAKKDKK